MQGIFKGMLTTEIHSLWHDSKILQTFGHPSFG